MTTTYSLGSEQQERERLAHQAGLLDRITERFLHSAGLAEGMRVLDVGCGVGDVALIAARMVGDRGEVVAIDSDPTMLATAEERIQDERVRFIEADLTRLALDEAGFDAVVGRLILMHVHDPVVAVRLAANHVRPNGIVAFQDFTTAATRVKPPLPQAQAALDRITVALESRGADVHAGDNLRETFLGAGLPEPELSAEVLIGGGAGNPVIDMIAGVTRTLNPETDTARLARHLREEAGAHGVIAGPPMIGAWTRKP